MKTTFKYLVISNLLLGLSNLNAGQLPQELNSNNGNSGQAVQTSSDVKIDIDEKVQIVIASTSQIEGKDSTLESFCEYLNKHDEQPKTVDEDTNNFITHLINSNTNQINTVLNTIYTNDDGRKIPHPNQYKKSSEVITLGLLRQADDYLYNATFNATGKTNKEICEAVRSA